MNDHHIYMLTNPAAPGVIKLGRTNDLKRRVADHNRGSNVIGRWEVAASVPVPKKMVIEAETKVLRAFRRQRVEGKREQFKIAAGGMSKAKSKFFGVLAQYSKLAAEARAESLAKAQRVIAENNAVEGARTRAASKAALRVRNAAKEAEPPNDHGKFLNMGLVVVPAVTIAMWVWSGLNPVLVFFLFGVGGFWLFSRAAGKAYRIHFDWTVKTGQQERAARAEARDRFSVPPHSKQAYERAKKLIEDALRAGYEVPPQPKVTAPKPLSPEPRPKPSAKKAPEAKAPPSSDKGAVAREDAGLTQTPTVRRSEPVKPDPALLTPNHPGRPSSRWVSAFMVFVAIIAGLSVASEYRKSSGDELRRAAATVEQSQPKWRGPPIPRLRPAGLTKTKEERERDAAMRQTIRRTTTNVIRQALRGVF